MDETKLARIPRVVTTGALGPKDYGLVLTDLRSIFVLEKASKAALGGALGGVIGSAIAHAAASRSMIDYDRATPEELARMEKSVVIPHSSIVRISLRRKLGSHRLRIDYVREDGKEKTMEAIILPPAELVSEGKARGMKPRDTVEAYAGQIREAYVRALPPAAAAKAEWGP